MKYYIQKLDNVNRELKSKEASFQRVFIEKRYNENLIDLGIAEDKLKLFQEKHKMISISDQSAAAIEIAAEIKAEILASEVELEVARKIFNENNHEIIKVEHKINALKSQFDKLNTSNMTDDFFPSFSNFPYLGLKLARLMREVSIQNQLFIYLTQQYEEAKIKEAKDSPTVLVLDKGVSPNLRSSPKRFFIFISTFISILILSCIVVYVLEANKLNIDN